MSLTSIIILIVVLVVSAIPLNLAVKILGGRSSILKVILVNFIVGLIGAYLNSTLGWLAGIVSFIAMLFIYKIIFGLGWIRAFLAWILQAVIIAIIIIALILIAGVTLLL